MTRPRVRLIGVPLNFGASMAGVDLGPAALRIAKLPQRIAQLGYEVIDDGDLRIERPLHQPAAGEKAKYLNEVRTVCEDLSRFVREALAADELPIVVGGDHSIAIGSIAGVATHFRERERERGEIGLIWFDAHADMNTPETSPSGNIHGMPLAVALGRGPQSLTDLGGFAPKIDARFCAHIGGRDLDAGERALIKELGMRFFTMREIDERGMGPCVDEALRIAGAAPAGRYHVTFDVDVLDPGDAPGSGTLVRGGLTYREAHLALEKIAEDDRTASLEIVEINTALDSNNRTAELGVELILSALGKTIL